MDEYRPEDDDTPCIYPDWDYYHTQTGVVVLAARMDSLFKILTGEHNWSYWARGIAGDYIVQFADGTTLVFPARIFHALFVLTEAL